jgi:hypothetical protein
MLRIRVVLPEPRKPVIMVMGGGGMVGARGWVLGGVETMYKAGGTMLGFLWL